MAEAVSKALGAEKMNRGLLGNGDSRLHWHLFPRPTERNESQVMKGTAL